MQDLLQDFGGWYIQVLEGQRFLRQALRCCWSDWRGLKVSGDFSYFSLDLHSDRFNFGGLSRDTARVMKTARGKTARLVTARPPAKAAAGSEAKSAEGEAKKVLKVIPKKGQPVRYSIWFFRGIRERKQF